MRRIREGDILTPLDPAEDPRLVIFIADGHVVSSRTRGEKRPGWGLKHIDTIREFTEWMVRSGAALACLTDLQNIDPPI